MNVNRRFASSNTRVTQPGVPADATALNAPYAAMSAGAVKVGTAVEDYAKAAMKRDAAAIVADTLTSVHEETNRDYIDATQNIVSSANDPDDPNGFTNIDAKVKFKNTGNRPPELNDLPFSTYVIDSYDRRVEDRLNKIKNPIAQNELREKFSTLRSQLSNQAFDFEARTTRDIRLDMVAQSADRAGRLVLDNPTLYDQQAEMIGSSIRNARLGADTLQTETRTVNQLAVAAAQGWIELDPEKAKTLLAKDSAASFRQQLSPEQIVSLQSRAETKLEQNMAQVRTKLSLQEASHRESLLETGEGIPGYEEAMTKAYANQPEVLAQKTEEYAVLRSSFSHKTQLDGMPLSDVAAYAAKLRPASGDEQFATKSKVADFLEKYAAEQVRMAEDDPGLLVEQLNQNRFSKIQDARERALLRISLQDQKGIPAERQRLLTNSELTGIVQTIQSTDPNQVLNVIQNFTQTYDGGANSDQSISDRFYRELTAKKDGLAPTYNVLLQNVRDGSPVAFDLVRSLSMSKDLKKYFAKESDESALKEKVAGSMRDWSQGFLRGDAENLTQVQQMQDVATNLSKLYMLDQGLSQPQAVEKATRMLVTDKLALNDGPLQIPKQIFSDGRRIPAVPNVIKGYLQNFKKAMLNGEAMGADLDATFGGVPDYVSADQKKEMFDLAVKRGYWKTNGSYTGARFMVPLVNGDLPLLDKSGNPLEVPFSEAQTATRLYSRSTARKPGSRTYN